MMDPWSCNSDSGPCQRYNPGHNMHQIHAKRIGSSPWGWRDAVVAGLNGRWVSVDYFFEEARLSVWHHQALNDEMRPGDPVRVHEGLHTLGGTFGWLNVAVRGGLGAFSPPADAGSWAAEYTPGIQDLATGRGVPLDHPPRNRPTA